MTRPIRVAAPFSAQQALPAASRRRSDAERWLETLLPQWSLQPGLAGRWLAAADVHLRSEADLVLTAEYDRELQVFTLEMWRGHQRVYGIDDWVGELRPE